MRTSAILCIERQRHSWPFMRITLMKQSRKGKSKERLVDILVYGWATSKRPRHAAARKGSAGGETAKFILP
jgi:hypothetical protein